MGSGRWAAQRAWALITAVPSPAQSPLGSVEPCYLFIPLPHPPQVIDVQLRLHILLPVEGNKRHLGWQGDYSQPEGKVCMDSFAKGVKSSRKSLSLEDWPPSQAHSGCTPSPPLGRKCSRQGSAVLLVTSLLESSHFSLGTAAEGRKRGGPRLTKAVTLSLIPWLNF